MSEAGMTVSAIVIESGTRFRCTAPAFSRTGRNCPQLTRGGGFGLAYEASLIFLLILTFFQVQKAKTTIRLKSPFLPFIGFLF
jgi:hypothetical protein